MDVTETLNVSTEDSNKAISFKESLNLELADGDTQIDNSLPNTAQPVSLVPQPNPYNDNDKFEQLLDSIKRLETSINR